MRCVLSMPLVISMNKSNIYYAYPKVPDRNKTKELKEEQLWMIAARSNQQLQDL